MKWASYSLLVGSIPCVLSGWTNVNKRSVGNAPIANSARFYTHSPAKSSQVVGTVTATNNPTRFAITAGNSAGDFAIDNYGNIIVTAQGQTDLNGSLSIVDFALTVTASSGSGSSNILITVYADGYADAPPGTAQFPTLLNGYHAKGVSSGRAKGNGYQPNWNVAGVDYAVGIPSGTSLSSPTTINNPNVSVNLANHHVTVTGNNVTLSGIDFSLNGGWQLILNGVTGTTIENCNFAVGTNAQPMFNGDIAGTNNTTIKNCVFNMGGLDDNFNAGAVNIQGNVTATYNLIENAAADLWDQGGTGSTVQNLTLKYNVFANAGQGASGLHPDQLQLGGGTYTVDVEYNTYYQSTLGPAGGTQGIFPDIADKNGTTVVGSNTISNNTFIALAGTHVNFQIAAQAQVGAGNTFVINANYFDPTGDGSVFKYTSTRNAQTNNFNMVTGALLRDARSRIQFQGSSPSNR
jgi:hypothetical protein